jgi:hypothetical protein
MVSRLTNLTPGPGLPVRPGLPPTKLPEPTPDISLPPRLNRPPTTADLIIKRTFDGLSPEAAAGRIKSAFQGTIAPQNQSLVNTTVDARVRDMQVVLNNVFTPGTPNRRFLESQLPADLKVIGSLSQSNPVVYEVTKQGQPPKYYTKGWSGSFVELAKPPVQVVMCAQLTLEPRGLRMNYPAWSNKALGGQITTITEG